jgi:hypothetical protein
MNADTNFWTTAGGGEKNLAKTPENDDCRAA